MTHHTSFFILLWSDYTAQLVKNLENNIFFPLLVPLLTSGLQTLGFWCHSIEAKLVSDPAKDICLLSIEIIVTNVPWPTAELEVDITGQLIFALFLLHLLWKQSCTGNNSASTFSRVISLPQNWLFLCLIWSQFSSSFPSLATGCSLWHTYKNIH